jgi:hypothetical protein
MGVAAPRIAPPVPSSSNIAEYEAAATELGITLYPWQKIAARYITARHAKRWKYREVAIVVARQNGKTELLIPRILMGLRDGESILHTAQNRDIPRKTFLKIAALLEARGLFYSIRKANGQEEITAPGGGRYKLIAPRAGVRGETADLVLIDEVREQHDLELMDAMLPTTTARPNSQIIYLSNAGDSESVVLNDLRRRGVDGQEARYAYLEWSASPERALDERAGWAEANPALGYGQLSEDALEYFHLNRPGPSFETEHLCRWVISTQPQAVPRHAWMRLRATLEAPLRPVMGVSMDVSGHRASAVIAWQQTDGTIALRVLADVTGDPIDTDLLGRDLKAAAAKMGVRQAAYDTLTDQDLARHLRNPKPMIGREFANASEHFVRAVDSSRIRWDEADVLTDDLEWTSRKPYAEGGAFLLTKVQADRPVTAALAAVRAVWLAAAPTTQPKVL